MTITITNTWVRPNTEIDWYVPPDLEIAYIKTNFQDNGKISTVVTYSDDELTKTIVTTVKNDTVREEWEADSTIQEFQTARNTYYNNNSVSKSSSISS
jgi:hypothetical protein